MLYYVTIPNSTKPDFILLPQMSWMWYLYYTIFLFDFYIVVDQNGKGSLSCTFSTWQTDLLNVNIVNKRESNCVDKKVWSWDTMY